MDKPLYIVGNWKSNKTVLEAVSWFKEFEKLWHARKVESHNLSVIICASFIHLLPLVEELSKSKLPVHIGCQNISPFPNGAYTGEISAQMLTGLVTYCLVGHSERRKYFGENVEMLAQKVTQAKNAWLEPIYCVQDDKGVVPQECKIVAYEPLFAIGTGKPDSPENANQVAKTIRSRLKNKVSVIYGGSVTEKNVASFLMQPEIDGVLPGGASLDPAQFINLLVEAGKVVK